MSQVENPSTWTEVEETIHETYNAWWECYMSDRFCVLSLPAQIAKDLREKGLLNEKVSS